VEGPLDAIAVTLATDGRAVGIAPLGTAFTASQAEQLKPYWRDDPSRIVIATDPDAAGWRSAQRAFWRLAALGACPQHLALPHGVDPADVLSTEGAAGLADRLASTREFGSALIDRLIRETDLSETASRIWLARDIARVLAPLPPEHWPEQVHELTTRLDLPGGILHLEVVEAGLHWTDDAPAFARREIAAVQASSRPMESAKRPPRPIISPTPYTQRTVNVVTQPARSRSMPR